MIEVLSQDPTWYVLPAGHACTLRWHVEPHLRACLTGSFLLSSSATATELAQRLPGYPVHDDVAAPSQQDTDCRLNPTTAAAFTRAVDEAVKQMQVSRPTSVVLCLPSESNMPMAMICMSRQHCINAFMARLLCLMLLTMHAPSSSAGV